MPLFKIRLILALALFALGCDSAFAHSRALKIPACEQPLVIDTRAMGGRNVPATYAAIQRQMTSVLKKSQGVGFDLPLGPGQAYVKALKLASPFEGAVVLLFPDQVSMNSVLMRAAAFIEMGRSLTWLNSPEAFSEGFLQAAAGHNLAPRDLMTYWASMGPRYPSALARNSSLDLSAKSRVIAEIQFFNQFLVPFLRQGPDPSKAFFIAFSADVFQWVYLVHEFRHVQYFQDPRYAKVVWEFFSRVVMPEDQDAVMAELGQFYDFRRNPRVLPDEFQAHLLSPPISDLWENLGPKYRERLIQELRAAGVTLAPI